MPLHVSKICFVYKRLVSMYHGIGKFIYSFLMQSHSLTNRTECFWSNNGVFLLFFFENMSFFIVLTSYEHDSPIAIADRWSERMDTYKATETTCSSFAQAHF